MTPETEAAREAVTTALEIIDGESWHVDGAGRLLRSQECAMLADLDRVRRQLPSAWFDGLYDALAKVRAELLTARTQLEAVR